MLHFENTAKLSLKLLPRDRFFNKQLLIALSLAAFVHLIALLLVHVPLSPNQASTYIFPQVFVEVTGEPKSPFPSQKIRRFSILYDAPPTSKLLPSKTPLLDTNFNTISLTKKTLTPPTHLNSEPFSLTLLNPPKQPLTLHLSPRESLSKRKISTLPQSPLPSEELHMSYSIRIDNATGIVFFSAPLETYPADSDAWAQTLLQSIRFEPKPGTLSSGIMDIDILERTDD